MEVNEGGCSRAAETRMARGDQARPLGQEIEHRRARPDTDARMQEQQRPPAAPLDQLDADAVDDARVSLASRSAVAREPSLFSAAIVWLEPWRETSIASCWYMM